MSMTVMHKYKLITGKDLLQSVNDLQNIIKSNNFDQYTKVVEPLFFGLSLAKDYVNIDNAKTAFNEFLETGDMGEYAEKYSTDKLVNLINTVLGVTSKNTGE